MAIAFVQSAHAGAVDSAPSLDVTLGAAPTDGNTLIAAVVVRSGDSAYSWPSWTHVPDSAVCAGVVGNGHAVDIYYRSVGTGESATITTPVVGSHYREVTIAEFSGVLAFDVSDALSNQGGSPSVGPVTPAADEILIIGSMVADTASTGWTPGTSFTEITDAAVPAGFQPSYEMAYRIVSSPTGTYSATATQPGGAQWGGVIAVFTGAPLDPGSYVDWDEDGFSVGDQIPVGHVSSWKVQQGASPEITGGAQPGSAEITLVNPSDDRYNPLNASGPYFGKLHDGIPIHLSIGDDGTYSGTTTVGVFGGRIKDVIPLTQGGVGRPLFVRITCEDALGWLSRTPARVEDGLYRTQAAFRAAVLAAAGETRTSLAHETTTMPISGWDSDALAALDALNKANGTRHYIRPEANAADWYTYVTRNRQWRLDATVDATLDAGSDAVTGADGWRLSADTVINQQKATVTPIRFTPGTVTVWQAETYPIVVTSTRPFETWVEFDDYVDGPVVDMVRTGTTPTTTLTAFGTSAKLVITSAGTTTITALSIEGSLLRRGQAESVVEDDTVSQAGSRGVRAGSDISGELVGVLASARGIAAHVVWRYGNPQYRPTVTIVNWFPDMFTLEMYDVVSLTVAEVGMTARLFEVVGRTLESVVAASTSVRSHTLTLVLQECRVQSDPGWFVLDTSELNSADVLAY